MTMHNDLLDRIRSRAYEIWLEEGQPLGRDEEHWARAEAEVLGNADAGAVTPDGQATPDPETATPEEAPKTTRRRATKKAAEPAAEGDEAPKPKRTRRTTKKTADGEAATSTEGTDAEAKPKRVTRRKKTED